jgi:ribosomal protein S18 acetylase RimI-like enzyme
MIPIAIIDCDVTRPGSRLSNLADFLLAFVHPGMYDDDQAADMLRVAVDAYGWTSGGLVDAILTTVHTFVELNPEFHDCSSDAGSRRSKPSSSTSQGCRGSSTGRTSGRSKDSTTPTCRHDTDEDGSGIEDLRRVLETGRVHDLRVDDLTEVDLRTLGWSGTRLHLVAVRRALDRVRSGEVEYLVVRAPNGYPLAKVAIDYAAHPDAGTLWQMTTIEELRSLGIGTHLISAAESRIRKRGASVAQLDVELDNPRARALYERLGYREAGRRSASWDVQEADGSISRYETEVAMLRKDL